MNKRIIELMICYWEQFGSDLDIGKHRYLDLTTFIELKRITDKWD